MTCFAVWRECVLSGLSIKVSLFYFHIGSRFHHNKGKHSKDSVVRPRTNNGLGSDNTEEGTRTRRRSCTVKTSLSPSPSPTPLIECPERNCNKKYKHINGLRYHQAHAHLDSVADPDEKVIHLPFPSSIGSLFLPFPHPYTLNYPLS